jgi:rubrerythrin
MSKESCDKVLQSIKEEQEASSGYDNLVELLDNVGAPDDVINKVREIADEERVHKEELSEIYKKVGCLLGSDESEIN